MADMSARELVAAALYADDYAFPEPLRAWASPYCSSAHKDRYLELADRALGHHRTVARLQMVGL